MLTSKSIRLQITINSSHLTLTKEDTTLLINHPEQFHRPQIENVAENKQIKVEVEMEEEENLLDDDYEGDDEQQKNDVEESRSERNMWTIQEEDSYEYSSMHDHSLMGKSIIESLCTEEYLITQIDELSTIKSNRENGNDSINSNTENKGSKNDHQNNEISTLNSANCEKENVTVTYLHEVMEWNLNAKHQNSEVLKQNKICQENQQKIVDINEAVRSENIMNFDFSENLNINCSNFLKISNLINARLKEANYTQESTLQNESYFKKGHKKGVSLFSKSTVSEASKTSEENKNIKKNKIKVKITSITSLR